ncbi:cellobiose dehydrogenase-like protein [Phanerochaete sordida]|uniref:Cellobiose dehydrogenase-like protein n=1 Tax=Phanerochaete sordida TaxID=48140 RepID=A0A9P3G5P4_9APHY|nr:cellobiose dehydrogenase-like protein [Phanerochaete sordida]
MILPLLCLYLAFASKVVGNATSDSPRACTSAGGVCINQITEPVTGIAFGFAVPQDVRGPGALGGDFVANITIPLPYGFAALQGGSSATPSPFHTACFMGGRVLPNASYDWFQIVQFDQLSPDGKTAVPVAGPNITISPLSFWHRDLASFVYRCTNCTIGGEVLDGKVQLGAVFSHIKPPFVVGRTNETVTMTNATIVPFVMDLQDIMRSDFADVLRGTGLE